MCAVDRTGFDGPDGRQKCGKSTHGGRFSRPSISEHQHTADGWVDRSKCHCAFHIGLPDDGGEWKWLFHGVIFAASRGRLPMIRGLKEG